MNEQDARIGRLEARVGALPLEGLVLLSLLLNGVLGVLFAAHLRAGGLA